MGVGISDEQVCLHLSPAVHCPISEGQEGRTSRGQLLNLIELIKSQVVYLSIKKYQKIILGSRLSI